MHCNVHFQMPCIDLMSKSMLIENLAKGIEFVVYLRV
jgi:hypothetical protein